MTTDQSFKIAVDSFSVCSTVHCWWLVLICATEHFHWSVRLELNFLTNKPTGQNEREKKHLKTTRKWKEKSFSLPFFHRSSTAAQSLKSNLIRLTWLGWHLKTFTSLNPDQTECVVNSICEIVWTACSVAPTPKLNFCLLLRHFPTSMFVDGVWELNFVGKKKNQYLKRSQK